jgi:hypothetical protein
VHVHTAVHTPQKVRSSYGAYNLICIGPCEEPHLYRLAAADRVPMGAPAMLAYQLVARRTLRHALACISQDNDVRRAIFGDVPDKGRAYHDWREACLFLSAVLASLYVSITLADDHLDPQRTRMTPSAAAREFCAVVARTPCYVPGQKDPSGIRPSTRSLCNSLSRRGLFDNEGFGSFAWMCSWAHLRHG